MKNNLKKLEYFKQYYQDNKEKVALRKKLHYAANKDKILESNKAYRTSNKDKCYASKKRYAKDNREKLWSSMREWRRKNKEHIKVYSRNKYHNNISRKLSLILRMHTNRAFKGFLKEKTTIALIGCSFLKARQYI